MEKIDLRNENKELYRATSKIKTINADKATFLSVDGHGAPGGQNYQEAISALYGVAYTAKFSLKNANVMDFGIPPMECQFFDDPKMVSMNQWKWRLLIRIPSSVQQKDIKEAQKTLLEKKGLNASAVKRISWNEGDRIQTLHVGPYDQVGPIYDKLKSYAEENNLQLAGPCHEIYLSDPRRTSPDKLKTIVTMPVKKELH